MGAFLFGIAFGIINMQFSDNYTRCMKNASLKNALTFKNHLKKQAVKKKIP